MKCSQAIDVICQHCRDGSIIPIKIRVQDDEQINNVYIIQSFKALDNNELRLPSEEVVKVDLIPCEESSQIIEQNVSIPTISPESIVAAELVMGNVTLRLYNNANEQLIEKTIQCIGGIKHAW